MPIPRRQVVAHECSHLVTGVAVGMLPARVAITARGGVTIIARHSWEDASPMARLTFAVSGHIGERVAGFEPVGAVADLEEARRLLATLARDRGSGSWRRLLEIAARESERLVRARWSAIEALADALYQRSEISGLALLRLLDQVGGFRKARLH